jgi:hypothetical protein
MALKILTLSHSFSSSFSQFVIKIHIMTKRYVI